LSLTDINCHDDIPETAATIEGNAALKVAYVKAHYGLDCFADDTGLEVAALNNEPGVFSARYAGQDANAEKNMAKLLANLENKEDRSARFKTIIALSFQGLETSFEGICEGRITKAKQGDDGFGYDPIFLPTGSSQTFAQMTLEEKSEIGHRGKAMRQLIGHFNTL
jgi:XTP/dITP diphosphohydrolase